MSFTFEEYWKFVEEESNKVLETWRVSCHNEAKRCREIETRSFWRKKALVPSNTLKVVTPQVGIAVCLNIIDKLLQVFKRDDTQSYEATLATVSQWYYHILGHT